MMRSPSQGVCARANEIDRQELGVLHRRTDQVMVALLVVQWIGAIATALTVSPTAWAGAKGSVHPHVVAAVCMGGLLTLMPAWLMVVSGGSALTRHAIAGAQVMYSALLIHLGGGRIEWHFHVFGSLAFLAFYRDWKILVTATVVVAVDHLVRGLWWPSSIFGVGGGAEWRWLEHAGWVLFEDAVLVVSIVRSMREGRRGALAMAMLESSKSGVEDQVRERTAQLDAALGQAQAAIRAKSAFLANMSHEVRTPMAAILGYTEILEDGSSSAEDRSTAMKSIRASGNHLLTLVGDVLELARAEGGASRAIRGPVDVGELLRDVGQWAERLAEAKGLDVRLETVGDAIGVIESDRAALRRILVNLVDNAVKFTPNGSVTIRAEAVCESTKVGRERLRISVIDTGIGIAEANQSTIFGAFAQVDPSGTRKFGGSGLGLPIAQRLAVTLGGTISVNSQEGRGSCFTLDVPAVAIEATGSGKGMARAASAETIGTTDEPRSALPTVASKNSGPAALTPVSVGAPAALVGTVLLAEDGPDNQRLFAHHLRRAGATVETVENGLMAVQRVLGTAGDGKAYDLILMDMQMPELDGYAATRRLREAGYQGPIMALTAHAMAEDRAKCLEAGCDDYESKPITGARLIAAAGRYLSPARRAA